MEQLSQLQTVNTVQTAITMIIYIAVVVGIGIYFAKKSNESSADFFIGGRRLGPWVAAMSAEASDMSGWLLMGLPGVAYWCGLADAFWTAIGLAIGTWLNWLFIAKPLRRYSETAGNAITIPEYFSNRFLEKRKVVLLLASLMIVIFFSVYAGSCFVTVGKLFGTLFGMEYRLMMVVGAVIVILYTLLGGFLAESTSDFMQGIIMFISLLSVLVVGVIAAGGVGAVLENLNAIPGFVDFFGIASPVTDGEGVQSVAGGVPLFGEAGVYGLITIISTMSWGLGYFGMPQVLLRFMAIRKVNELTRARRVAVVWVFISLFAAVAIGLLGRALYPDMLLTAGMAENIFIRVSTILLHPLVAGFAMAGILAATMSSSDSYLLIASSAIAKNIFGGILKRDATDRQIMSVSRITLLLITLVGVVIALDENSVIFTIVSFAWAGFGACFGPLMILSLFWRRITRSGAVAGILGGGGMVFFWKLVIRPLGGAWNIYELLPAFLVSCAAIIIVSLLSKPPEQAVTDMFDRVREAGIKDKQNNGRG